MMESGRRRQTLCHLINFGSFLNQILHLQPANGEPRMANGKREINKFKKSFVSSLPLNGDRR